MPTGAAFMILISLVVGFVGLVLSSEASAGASVVGFACLLGIIGRMLQASAYEKRRT